MKRFPVEFIRAVEPALQAARKVLNDLDPDDVPASLRRVVAHSGTRLTPPLATKLVAELDRLEWLRTDTASRLPEDADGAARAFVERSEGWWSEVIAAVVAGRTAGSDAKLEAAERESRKQREVAAAARAKLKQQRIEAKDRLAGLRDEVKVLRRRAEAAEGADARKRSDLEAQLDELERETVRLRAELTGSDRTLDELRERLRAQRRALASAERELAAGGSASVERDPLALARALDLAAASVPRRQPEPTAVEETPARSQVDRFAIPAGVRPDRAESVEWLLDQGGVTVLVDGYNLLFNLEPGEFTTGAARKRLGKLMAHFARKAGLQQTVRIVFDSTIPGHRDTRWAGPGVEVTFAEADRLADEELVALAESTAPPVVVVSSDREVREDAARTGAVVLWSEAFVEWFAGT
ncbi:MAG: NYN domain-containing protein [Acidimicrobiia bacterium]|nr:NYN domain-containing protein [Acidimicrobiia bacterium]